MKRVKDVIVKSAESWATPRWQMQRKRMIRVDQEILAFAADKETVVLVLCWIDDEDKEAGQDFK